MPKFLKDYLLFTVKSTTIILIFFLISFGFGNLGNKENKLNDMGLLTIQNLTEQYNNIRLNIIRKTYSKKEADKIIADYQHNKVQSGSRTFVIKFDGDIQAKEVDSLKKEINAILSIATKEDKVVLILESPGGTVNGYGLAASELERIRDKGINLTVLIDKVAASGGYMMAVIGNKIIAAPFAIIGSIGVLMEMPNFNDMLEKEGVRYEQITSGKYKRTISMLGKNTEEGRKKMQQDLDGIHQAFKELIKLKRENVDIEKISTGEYWLAKQAKELGLVDEIMTSDNYLTSLYKKNTPVFLIKYERKIPFMEKVMNSLGISSNILNLNSNSHMMPLAK
jgi:serine protease SohB